MAGGSSPRTMTLLPCGVSRTDTEQEGRAVTMGDTPPQALTMGEPPLPPPRAIEAPDGSASPDEELERLRAELRLARETIEGLQAQLDRVGELEEARQAELG